MRQNLATSYEALRNSDFAVNDAWTVRDELFAAHAPAGLSDEHAQLSQERRREAEIETIRLQRVADEVGAADEDTARRISELLADAEKSIPVGFGFHSAGASHDVEALPSGKATREQRERFLHATSLDAAREVGDDVVINKNQMDLSLIHISEPTRRS